MKKLFFFILLFGFLKVSAQDTPKTWQEYFDITGYVKYLNTANFHNADDLLTDNLWHNRINFIAFVSSSFSLNAGWRNRLLYGDMIQNPFYRQALSSDNGIFDLSTSLVNQQKLLMISQFDRLNIDYSYQNIEITLGRQRINWGKNLVWNPNDIFNTANFLDTDYEEKAGVDALRVRYNIGELSQIDLVYSAVNKLDEANSTLAMAFHSAYQSFDYQLLAGYIRENYVLGLGWEGNLKQMGFKGETSYFLNHNYDNVFTSSFSLDYAFKSGKNWLFSVLYNGGYKEDSMAVLNLLNAQVDVQNIFPSDWAFYNQFSGDFGPAWFWSFGSLYGMQNNLIVLMPAINYSISDRWEANLYAQSYFADIPNMKQRNILTFRLRYDF